MVENLGFTKEEIGKKWKPKRICASPLPRFLAAIPCSNCVSHSRLHFPIVTHLPLQPQKGEKPP